MDNVKYMEAALSEHRFWLQIMGDHSRFIFLSLAPSETTFLQKAGEFIFAFDDLLEQSHNQLTADELKDLQMRALELTYQLRDFKLHLLELSLNSDLKSHLPPSFYNDMLNELDEYLLIITTLMDGNIPIFHPVHYHLLWLFDAVGHSSSIASALDMVETDIIEKAKQYQHKFLDLDMKAITMHGYLRTGLQTFPSLDRLNEQAGNLIAEFYEFLESLRDQRMDERILGTLMPLAADHMSREECYYLWKLSQSAKNIHRPDCDPARSRVEA